MMALFALADLHLPLGINKPMDIFSEVWENYVEKIEENWNKTVSDGDVVVICGDISWATYLEQSYNDFEFINRLNGEKIILKGNHDYWWTTLKKLNTFTHEHQFDTIKFLHNNYFTYQNYSICGTRGWSIYESMSKEDLAFINREAQRLELSIETALKNSDNEIIAFMHYPPVVKNGSADTSFSSILKKYGISKCCYGHLHSSAKKFAVDGFLDGIEYHLVSCDYVDFTPKKII